MGGEWSGWRGSNAGVRLTLEAHVTSEIKQSVMLEGREVGVDLSRLSPRFFKIIIFYNLLRPKPKFKKNFSKIVFFVLKKFQKIK